MEKETNIIKKALSKKITRRTFLKWSSAIGATATMAGLVSTTATQVAAGSVTDPVTSSTSPNAVVDYIPSVCLVCHSWCRIAVGIDKDKVVRKIEGLGGQPKPASSSHTGAAAKGNLVRNIYDDTYTRYCQAQVGQLPYSTHNRGRICAKGNDGMEHLYDPDRVKYPLVRAGKRGEGKWRRVSWGELYLGDKYYAASGSPSTQDIYIDDGTGKHIHWPGIARVLRDLGASSPGSRADYSYTDSTGSYYDDIPALNGSATDRRHRLLIYIGRNEGGDIWGRFQDAYGTHQRIEHTNLCEESRHTANEWYMKDKFPIANLGTVSAGVVINDTRVTGTNAAGNQYTLDAKDNTDCFISWGGNIVEASIPHASLSQRVADVRRRGGRIIGIDVKQTNTLAYADEQFYINPGTDGALAAAIIYEIMNGYGVAALKSRIDSRPNTGAHYNGLFKAEESAGAGAAVPSGKSLESYLYGDVAALTAYGYPASGTFPDGRTSGQAFDANYASGICGIAPDDIKYLAWLCSDGFGAGNSTPPGGSAAVDPPRNPLVDGYRGPCKHSNGTYNYGLLRALQFIACGYDDGSSIPGDAQTEAEKRAGGVNRPGGLIYDSWRSAPGSASDGHGQLGGAPGGATSTYPAAWPKIQQDPYPAKGQHQLVDTWDYHGQGGSKWRCNLHHVFSNTLVGVRASLGLDPYIEGSSLNTLNTNPFGNDASGNPNPAGNTYDHNFTIEAMLMHKVNAVYDLPNPAIEHELFTKTGSKGYLLKHLWACDLCMGDSTRYADAILPDSSYLERYDYNDFENVAHLGMTGLRQPAIQVTGGADEGKNLALFDSKPIRNILYGLARAVESAGVNANGDSTTKVAYTPWNGAMFDSFDWSGSNSDISDRDYARTRCNGSAVSGYGGYADGFEYYRTNGIYEGSGNTWPNFWKDSYGKVDTTGTAVTGIAGGAVEFYHGRLDAVADPTTNEVDKHSDGTFFGTPIYYPPTKQGDPALSGTPDPANGVYNLTTYRLNVHTHARTASCPRLQEIIGTNWAMMAVGSKDINGNEIKNGDKVKITSAHHDGIASDTSVKRSIILEAKVTPKIMSGVVAISHSQGHDLASFGGDGAGGAGYQVTTDGISYSRNRSDTPAPGTGAEGGFDFYRVNAVGPSAPSTEYNSVTRTVEPTKAGPPYNLNHGTHPNWAINRGGEDPVGTSVAWFDTMVEVEKLT
jgi:anaerobic selenocysteine-containing dehydrogenase